MCGCVCVCVFVCMCVCLCLWVCVYMYVWVCVCIFFIYYSMPHYMAILHALLNLIISFTVAFNNNKIILDVIYTRNINNNILTSKAYN